MKKIFTLIMGIASTLTFAQHFNVQDYPKGVYETFEDFRSKTPSKQINLSEAYTTDQLAYRFNNMDEKGKKFKKAFAVSDGKNLYIHVVNLLKKFNSEDKGQTYDGGIYYLKAENHGGYLFLRDYFVSSSAAMWGGLIATAAARRQKAVIYEEEKESFNMFKNFEEFKTYMEVNYPKQLLDIEKKNEDGSKKEEIDMIIKNLDKVNQQ